jgi:hypothetical protein
LVAIVESRTHVTDAASQCLVGDGHVGPNRADKFVFRDETADVLDQMAQDFEALRPQRNFAIVIAERATA